MRGGWRAREREDKSRSENEGLDSLSDGLAEVEAGDLRDGERTALLACFIHHPPFKYILHSRTQIRSMFHFEQNLFSSFVFIPYI